MPLTQMPDGSYVNIDDKATPEAIARIKAQYRAKPRVTANRVTPAASAREKFISGISSAGQAGGEVSTEGFFNRLVHGATLGLDDKLSALAATGMSYLDGGAGKSGEYLRDKSFGERFGLYNAGLKRMRGEEADAHPVFTGAADMGGMLLTPIGAETGVGRLATRIAPTLAGTVKASRVGQLTARAGESAIGRGARTGFNYGAASSFIDNGNVGDAFNSGLLGASVGGALGAGVHGGGKVLQAIADRAPANASRVAYAKIADMLGRTRRPGDTHMAYSPQAAEREMAVSAARGHEPMLMDLSPEMHNAAGWLARKPNLRAANTLVDAGENRIAGAADRFDSEVGRRVASTTGDDAYALKQNINAARRGQGMVDYAEGGAMDTPVNWSPKLEKFFKDSPDADRLIKQAYTTAQRFGEDIVGSAQGNQLVPSMRAFDYLKREFDGEIGAALRSGNRTLAAGLSKHLGTLKNLLAEANPEYQQILARQRDEFQRISSTELGQSIFKRMTTRQGAKELLAELRGANVNPEELKTGIADALLSMRNSSESPIRLMRRFMRSSDQRAVLEHAFGGTKNLNMFDKFMRRELRGMRSDDMLARGRQSATNIFQQHGDAAEAESVGQLVSNVLRGQAFGGITGAVSGGVRTVDQLRRGIGPAAQEEMARILMGRGEGLTQGIDKSRKFAVARRAAERKRARMAAKFGAYAVSGNGGE